MTTWRTPGNLVRSCVLTALALAGCGSDPPTSGTGGSSGSGGSGGRGGGGGSTDGGGNETPPGQNK
jgi:hypothetical protein